MVEAALIGSTHKDLDDASLWSQTDRDAALKGLMGPVSSIEAGPFLIEVEALGQLDAGSGLSRIDDEGTFHRQLNGDGLASGNIEDVIFVGWFRLSDLDDRYPLQQTLRRALHAGTTSQQHHTQGCQPCFCLAIHAGSPWLIVASCARKMLRPAAEGYDKDGPEPDCYRLVEDPTP